VNTSSTRLVLHRWLAALAAVIGAFFPIFASAQGAGDLLVAPTRLVFEGRQRTAEVTLVNIGAKTATYRLSFVQLRMNADGGTQEIQAADKLPDELFAHDLIRYSPRQVTLEPRAAQTIRLQLRKPEGLVPGEYRSHLLFRAVPTDEPRLEAPADAVTVRLTPIYGVSIPVIVRHGELQATAQLTDLALTRGDAAPTLDFQIRRAGDRSVYGNLSATFTPAGGKPVVVGQANGVAVYATAAIRHATLELRLPPGTALGRGRLHLAYTEQGGSQATIADADLEIP
jgi:P pilus assembly chaperone PapD